MGFDEVLEGMLPTMTGDMNSDLNRSFLAEEVQRALHQMAPLIAPGPNGMSPIFYKSFWHIVGNDVIMAVLSALNTSVVPNPLTPPSLLLYQKFWNQKGL